MKKLLILTLALALMLVPSLSLAQSSRDDDDGVITVSGRASVTVEPDKASINFGVEMLEDDAKTAQTKVNAAVNAAVDAIKALGVDEKSIQTESISIYRRYDYSGDTPVPAGFNASTSIIVSIDDITLAGAVIDVALDAGANNVNNISFSSSKQAELYDQALAAAMENARHKGDILATAAGSAIAGIESVSEDYSGDVYTTHNAATYDMEMASTVAGTSISTGTLEISASVTATFNLK